MSAIISGYMTSIELEDAALDAFTAMHNHNVPVVDMSDLDEPLTESEIAAINASEHEPYIVLTADQLDQILARMHDGDDLADILGGLPLISAA